MIHNKWYAILPSKAVKINQITATRRLNSDLALFRNSKGDLGCVVDQCTHRGASLSLGKVKGDCIECPFHGLQFDRDGKCRFIPANGKASTDDTNRYNVKTMLVKEKNDIIFLWFGDEDKAENEKLPFFDAEVDETYVYSELKDHWNAHYSRCIENQLDVVHLPFVHHNTIGRGNKTLVNGLKVVWEDGILTTSANNDIDEGQRPKSAQDCVIKETHLSFIYPNVWMNHISNKIKVIIYFAPVDDENTILYIRFYCKATPLRLVNILIAFLGKYANKVIERQDTRVVVTQKPKPSSLRSGEKLLTGDSPIITYRRIREDLKKI